MSTLTSLERERQETSKKEVGERPASTLANLAPEQRDVVRSKVQSLLQRSDSWGKLDPEERKKIARGMVDVVAYLADPAGGQPELAEALANDKKTGADKLQDRLAKKQDFAGKDFEAGAMEAGTKAFKELVGSVDFPKFVSGLIEGVFTSIVNSSIRQMEAYGKLLESVVKSVGEFANDNITLNNARDWMAEKHSDKLTIKIENNTPKLAVKPEVEDSALEELQKQLGLDKAIDLDDEESEAELARRAQLEMARMRQQQLATMVLLGINRIVVTDGLINAKVVFDVKANDSASRTARASMYDQADQVKTRTDSGGWFSSISESQTDTHKTVVTSSVDDQSESKAQLKASLTGEVRVNFKSETFPLERMASATEISSVNERAQK